MKNENSKSLFELRVYIDISYTQRKKILVTWKNKLIRLYKRMTTCSGFYLDQVSSKIVQTVHKNNFARSRFTV